MARNGGFSEQISRAVMAQCLDAIEYMHSKQICHRDLKLENIMIQKNGVVKIVDCGLAQFLQRHDEDGWLKTYAGTERYMLPEMHDSEPYKGEHHDLFALAVSIFRLYANRAPFAKAHRLDEFYRHLDKNRPHRFFSDHAEKIGKGEFFSKTF
jgi:serine/threonine protein kinase